MVRLLMGLVFLTAGIFGDTSAFERVSERIVEHRLENGLKFIILPKHDAPVFSFTTIVDAGSVDDPKGQTGMAHMFEHMAFKGTAYIGTTDFEAEKAAIDEVDQAYMRLRRARLQVPKATQEEIAALEAAMREAQEKAATFIKTNEFPKIIGQAGGVGLNAGTANDMTIYFYSLPSNKLELWMSMESERFLQPILREFYKERDVVKEERRMRTESSPFGLLMEEVLSASYLAHPYGIPGIGYMSDLDNLTMEVAREFFAKYYTPSNMTIVLVGDLDPENVISMAETYFGRIPAGPEPLRISTVEPPQQSERVITVKGSAQNIIMLAYHVGDARDSDWPVLEALSSVISGGPASRLHKRLVKEEQVAAAAGGFAGYPGSKYPSLFVFFAMPNQGHDNREALKLIDEELEKLKDEPISEQELHRVKTQARASLIRQLQSNSGLALQLAIAEVIQGDWRELFRSLDKINSVTAADIQRVAGEVFRSNARTVGLYEPEAGGE